MFKYEYYYLQVTIRVHTSSIYLNTVGSRNHFGIDDGKSRINN